jgi:tRNA(Ile)-lysidine synthetase-like protein
MSTEALHNAIAGLPAGAWAVGVSGGADSVALLTLLRARPDVRCHAVHLDHETRGGESTLDAQFVADLCQTLHIPCTLATRTQCESRIHASTLPRNTSARFRALRLHLFREVCAAHGLRGVLVAHHADDQAETILQRLLRGSGPVGLTGIRSESRVGGLTVLRPLLNVPSSALRAYLQGIGRAWREDASNASPAYQRNRVRALLARHPELASDLHTLAPAMARLIEWARHAAPRLGETFETSELADAPDVLAAEAARAWLVARGAPREALSPSVLERLVTMARDAATPPRAHFPGGMLVRRRRGSIAVVRDGARRVEGHSPAGEAASPPDPMTDV